MDESLTAINSRMSHPWLRAQLFQVRDNTAGFRKNDQDTTNELKTEKLAFSLIYVRFLHNSAPRPLLFSTKVGEDSAVILWIRLEGDCAQDRANTRSPIHPQENTGTKPVQVTTKSRLQILLKFIPLGVFYQPNESSLPEQK